MEFKPKYFFCICGLMCLLPLIMVLSCTKSNSPDDDTLSQFMINDLEQNIKSNMKYIRPEDVPGPSSQPTAYLIVWFPIRPDKIENKEIIKFTTCLDTNHARKVWMYKDGKLIEQEERQRVVEEYRSKYIENSPKLPNPAMYGYFEFGIISQSNQGAKVYLTKRWGLKEGSGGVLTLKRRHDGQWEIIDYKQKWVS